MMINNIKKKKFPLYFYRGKKTNLFIRLMSTSILVAKLQDRMKYTGYNAGAMLDFYLEILITSFFLGMPKLMKYGNDLNDAVNNHEISPHEISGFMKWFIIYSYNHGHPILYVSIFIAFVVPIIKVSLDKVVEHKTKARFSSYIEMLWAKRRKKYLDGIRASREDLGTEKYLKLVSVTNREYYSITGRRKPIWKSPYYKYSWWQKMFDWF